MANTTEGIVDEWELSMREWKNEGAWFLGDVRNSRGENVRLPLYIESPR